MNELDEILKHAGVKGMKWGVRKTVAKAGKAVNRSLNKRRAKSLANVTTKHEKYMSNKKYSKDYNSALKRTGSKATAMRTAQYLRRNRRETMSRAVLGVSLAGASKAYKFATKPETIRAGKNVVQTLKKSPVRYVDGSTFTNVINARR